MSHVLGFIDGPLKLRTLYIERGNLSVVTGGFSKEKYILCHVVYSRNRPICVKILIKREAHDIERFSMECRK